MALWKFRDIIGKIIETIIQNDDIAIYCFWALDIVFIHLLTIFIYQSINTHPNSGLGPVMAAEVTKGTFDLRGSNLKEQRGADKEETPHGGKC